MSELKETKKIKVFALPSPKNSLFFAPQSLKNTHKFDKIISKNLWRHRKRMLFCYMNRPKTYFEPLT